MSKLHISDDLSLPLDWMTLATVVYGARGCLAAETPINYTVRSSNGRFINGKGGTIQRLYERFHSLPPSGNWRGKYLRPQNEQAQFFAGSINDERLVVAHRIVDVVRTGTKECFEVVTVGGQRIVATADHRFFVGGGYVPLSSLSHGDQVWVHNCTRNPNRRPEPVTGKRVYLCVKHHPVAGVKAVRAKISRLESKYRTYEYHRIARARAVVEATMNGLALDAYVEKLNAGELDGLTFLGRDVDVHHKDEIVCNDTIDNLVVLPGVEHDRLHGLEQECLRYIAVPQIIASINTVGERGTFDISMADPFHNFIAAGFVTHNSGKTTFGSVCAEEVTKAGQRFCAIDLKGDWYGLKSTADGKDNGIPVVVFGGDHADVPLEESAGAFLGETVAGLSQSCILDFEHLSKGKQIRFLAPFFETLYHLNRDPLLLLLDEIQRYAPQKPMSPDEARCLGAVQDTVKLGRKHGLGLVSFTQRGAGLNKEVSELSDVLVAFRTPGPLDQERIKDWLDANTTKQQRDEVMGQLSGLGTGTAVIASGHPDLRIFGTYPIRRRETFDSSATPKIGKRRAEPKRLATPDLDELRKKMAGAIERQKADDPKELRRRIVELEREVAKKVPAAAPAKIERVEVPVIPDKQIEKLSKLLALAKEVAGDINATSARAMAPKVLAANTGIRKVIPERPTGIPTTASKHTTNGTAPANGETKLGRCERAILVALAQHHPARSSASRVAILAGYSVTSGGFNNSLSVLRTAGLIEGGGGAMAITQAGLDTIGGDVPALPSGEERLRYWQGRLGKCEAGILGVLAAAYPYGLEKADIAERAGYSDTSGGFNNSLSVLRTLELISGERGAPIRATEELLS